MGQNLRTLLSVAAELRSGGASWEAVAAKVSRRPSTCRGWPARFSDWEPLYREAQERRREEAGAVTIFSGVQYLWRAALLLRSA